MIGLKGNRQSAFLFWCKMGRSYPKISVEKYHQRSEISSTGLRCFVLEGPWVFYHRHVARTCPDADSVERRLGRVFHLAMEKPEQWMDMVRPIPRYIPHDFGDMTPAERRVYLEQKSQEELPPDCMRISKTFKRHRVFIDHKVLEFKKKQLVAVDADEWDSLHGMIQSVHDNPAIRAYLGRGPAEVACVYKDEDTGLDLRALADLLIDDVILDFKTTRFSRPGDFIRDAFLKGYVYQAAFYRRVFGTRQSLIVSVRNAPPWEAIVYEVPQQALDDADQSNLDELRKLDMCYKLDSWHSENWGVVGALSS